MQIMRQIYAEPHTRVTQTQLPGIQLLEYRQTAPKSYNYLSNHLATADGMGSDTRDLI